MNFYGEVSLSSVYLPVDFAFECGTVGCSVVDTKVLNKERAAE